MKRVRHRGEVAVTPDHENAIDQNNRPDKRLYTALADIQHVDGSRQLPALDGSPGGGDGAFVRIYVFARSAEEAMRRMTDDIYGNDYNLVELTDVAISQELWPMDNL